MPLNLKKYFTPVAVADAIKSAPPVEATVMDRLFPANLRQQYQMPLIPVSEITSIIGTAPVVQRGGQYVNVDGEQQDNVYIEPLPIRLEGRITGVDLNNLKQATNETLKSWAARKIQDQRRIVKNTTEALCAQVAFDAKISYPLLADGGQYVTYDVTYNGSLDTFAVAADSKWDHADFSLLKLYNFLETVSTRSDKAGYGGKKMVHAGALAFAQALALMEASVEDGAKSKVPCRLNEDGSINIGGHVIHKMAETYVHPKTKAAVPKLADKEIRVNSTGATGFYYGPVDDLDADLRPLPMYTKPVKSSTRGQLLLGESKPLPFIAPKSVIKAVVLA